MSARQPFVAFLAVLRVGALERCIWRVWIVTENPVHGHMCKGITAHAHLKKKAYQPQNTKIHSPRTIAFLQKKGITLMTIM